MAGMVWKGVKGKWESEVSCPERKDGREGPSFCGKKEGRKGEERCPIKKPLLCVRKGKGEEGMEGRKAPKWLLEEDAGWYPDFFLSCLPFLLPF